MLDTDTKRRIDTARDILVGKVPDPKSQVEQITIALIYKFMDDMDAESEELGGKRKFFTKEFARYGWAKLMDRSLGGHEMLGLYGEGISKMPENPGIPALFRDIFKNAYLPYRDPETLKAFLKIIDEFSYDHSERLGDAFEYLLSVLGSQGDAGQFRTPRHIIDFMVEVVDPKKNETILDPACGTAGFLISAYKFIQRANTSGVAGCPTPSPPAPLPGGEGRHFRGGFCFAGLKKRARELRGKQTDAEALLWDLLRDRQLADAKFRRQHQFGDYICDFYCDEAKLVVECDGDVHQTAERRQLDEKRDAYLKSQGITVLRFQNEHILRDTDPVLEAIAQHLLPPSPRGRGAGVEGVGRPGDLLTPDERGRLAQNIRGYDISPDMVRLSLVNLYLHGFTEPHIFEYDTLTSEERWHEFADVILANPPFMSPKGGIKPHQRFSIQAKRSEVLFVDYMAEHLTPTGRAAIIVPEGIIFQSQTAYKELRKMLVENSLVAVVSLPAGCFNPYSGVKTSILILDKSLAKQSATIAFFKVENDGFGLGAQRRAVAGEQLTQVQKAIREYIYMDKQDWRTKSCPSCASMLGSPAGFNMDRQDGRTKSCPSCASMLGSPAGFNMDRQDKQDGRTKSCPSCASMLGSPAGFNMDRQDKQDGRAKSCPSCSSMLGSLLESGLALIVPKDKIAANGDYNLSGERYREGAASNHSFPLVFLGEDSLFRVESGGTPKSDVEDYWGGGIPWATLVDLPATDFISQITTTKRTISDKGLRESSAKMIPANSVVVSTRATIGRIAINRVPIATNQGFKNVVIEDPSRAVPEFVALALTKLVPTMQAWATGGTFAEISKSKFCELQIPLPPLAVQQEIVAEIEGYQKVINGARAVLDHYRPHIPIHPDWPMVELGDVCETIADGDHQPPPKATLGVPFVTITNINDAHELDFTKTHFVPETYYKSLSANRKPRGGDVLYTVTGSYGIPVLVPDNIRFCFQRHIALIRTGAELLNRFLLHLLASPFMLQQGHQAATGVAQKTVSLGSLRGFKIPLPPLATQKAIVVEIEAEQALVAANRELITRFEQKIQTTLARVWGGEEPAAEGMNHGQTRQTHQLGKEKRHGSKR